MEKLNNIEGYYDVRVQPLVWGIRVQALRLAGDESDSVSALAARADQATALYYAPAGQIVTEANNSPR